MQRRSSSDRSPAGEPVRSRDAGRRDWLQPLRRLWSLARRLPSEQQFLDGDPVHYQGVLFLLDPADQTLIHVAVPLDQFEESEIPDMLREAREMFAEFVSERPSIEPIARQRALLVRIVASYERFEEEIGRRVRIDHWQNPGSGP